MGKTFSTGLLTNGVFQDASNNIGIGAAPSGTYKLEVTGTAKVSSTLLVSGAATFSSSVSATTGTFSGKISANTSNGIFSNFGGTSIGVTAGNYTGISLGYSENTTYTKTAIVQEQINDGNTRGHLHFLVDTANDGNNAVLGDSKMMINGLTGNVGIGTTTPARKLTVVGTIAAILSDANDVQCALSATATAVNIAATYGTTGSYLPLTFSTGSDERMRIENAYSVRFTSNNASAASFDLNYRFSSPDSARIRFATTSSFNQNEPGEISFWTRASDSQGGGSITERMRITSGGNVNIGDGTGFSDTKFYIKAQGTTSSTYAIVSKQSNGSTDLFVIRDDGYGFLKAAAWAYGSDRRIKENINYIQTGLDKILALKPATFDYIDGVKNNIGWIAQDVQEIIPEAVGTISETNDQLTLKSDFIVPFLVKAIQEQQTTITSLQDRLDKAGL